MVNSTQNALLIRTFVLYTKFFENENKASLLLKRDIITIHHFMKLIEMILADDFETNKEKADLLYQEINKIVHDEYFVCLKLKFGEDFITDVKVKKLNEVFRKLDNRNDFIDDINISIVSLHNFFLAYSVLVKHKNKLFIKELLVEFNNFLSHTVQAVIEPKTKDSNMIRASAHLHRGVLDSFKTIIHDNAEKIMVDNKLLKSFFKIRNIELDLIGEIESAKDKNNIQARYFKYVKKLLNFNFDNINMK